jgi:Zn-dependent metalloprotease
MPKLNGVTAKVEAHPEYKIAKRLYDIESKPSKEKPEKIARNFLAKVAPKLGLAPDLSELKFEKVKKTILGSHVTFQQQYQGLPVSGGWVKVDIDKQGRVFNVNNTLVPVAVSKKLQKARTPKARTAPAAAPLSKEKAKAIALKEANSPTATVLDAEKVTWPHEGVLTPSWKIVVQTKKPLHEWKMYLDASTGAVLSKRDQLKQLEGTGRVFDPNPVVSLNNTTLEDNSKIPDNAYTQVTLRELKTGGFLDGPFVSTINTTDRVKSRTGKFLFKRGEKGFNEVMVYFHIDRVQRYIQRLGFNNILNKAIKVNVNGRINEDNSFYSPGTKALTFGRGGVDDAEDAEIILHEYGHAIQDDQVPGFGESAQAGAMGEGFGDYLAASFFAESKPAKLRPCVGTWDAVAYSGDDPPVLRRLDSNKKFPKDLNNEVHDDGEIWSACLWELRGQLGRQKADTLILAHHFQISRGAGFEDAANALITVDKVLNEGRNENVIRDIFIRRGIFGNPKRKGRRAGLPFAATMPLK